MFKKFLVTSVTLFALLLLFVRYGRSLYVPIVNKLQRKHTIESRVEQLNPSAEARLQTALSKIGLSTLPDEILIAAFKEERTLEVYALKETGHQLLKTYPFTAYSGQLGPKLKEGDRQIPEGIYKVEYLNPNSSYHLSIKVSYPNEFDLRKSTFANKADLGGDIFIHGKAVTIDCIPIGDEGIEELFLLAKHALNQEINVIIAPRDFRKNKNLPEIKNVDWEVELYEQIKSELDNLP